jgi:hypothetical protein
LIAEAGDLARPFVLDQTLAFELEAEFTEETDRRCEVLDHDADVVHSESHLARLLSKNCPERQIHGVIGRNLINPGCQV